MFDIGAAELLVIVIVAVIVIGPKDMPLALRTVGRWVGKIRRVSTHFRTGFDAMVREAELEEMEKKWKAQNEAIMAKSSADTPADPQFSKAPDAPEMTGPPVQTAEDRAETAADKPMIKPPTSEPELPLGESQADTNENR
ncbi:Sec-independent protein translocase protein TatB [Altererythrobacter sp. GH1-8]|uniref:Sec-independent protein translocase protein TatB n=1 Tax=Altererythrobacter sp. GH1-8 TaxID=3349333 RepID=UPI00374DDC73